MSESETLEATSTRGGRRTELEVLAGLVDQAYQSDGMHSLLANLRSVRDEDWEVVPPGCGRSIGEIAEHAAWCKWMYENYAFGTASLRGDVPPLVPPAGVRARPLATLLTWMKATTAG